MEPTTPDSIDPPANVLLVHTGCGEPAACQHLRHAEEETAELRVSFSNERPDQRRHERKPAKLGLVSVGDVLRSASAESNAGSDTTGPDFSGPIAVDAIDDPSDLSAIGLSISRFCERWESDDERIVVCFRSLDTALRQTSPKKVFQFAHVLTNRLSSVGAYAHFHFDPTAFDDRTVATFGSIFDEVVCDDSVQGSLPEATDDEVAAVLEEWGAKDVDSSSSSRAGSGTGTESNTDTDADTDIVKPTRPSSEATDEDIARLLGQ